MFTVTTKECVRCRTVQPVQRFNPRLVEKHTVVPFDTCTACCEAVDRRRAQLVRQRRAQRLRRFSNTHRVQANALRQSELGRKRKWTTISGNPR